MMYICQRPVSIFPVVYSLRGRRTRSSSTLKIVMIARKRKSNKLLKKNNKIPSHQLKMKIQSHQAPYLSHKSPIQQSKSKMMEKKSSNTGKDIDLESKRELTKR